MSSEPRPTFRPTIDGSVAVPFEMLRDRELRPSDVVMALALTVHLGPYEHTTHVSNERLGELVGMKRRGVQECLARLTERNWITVSLAPTGPRKGYRSITLRWRLPDDFSDCRVPAPFGKRPFFELSRSPERPGSENGAERGPA